MKVFAFTGLSAAGKTFHAERLSKKYDIPLIETGKILYEEVKKKDLPINKENVKKVWKDLKEKNRAILTKLAIQKILKKHKNEKAVLFLTPKCLEELELLKKSFEKCFLIAFVSPPSTRFRRAVELKYKYTKSVSKEKKKEITDINTLKKFKEYRDEKELKLGVGKVIALADYYINTHGTRKEVKYNVKKLFEKLLK